MSPSAPSRRTWPCHLTQMLHALLVLSIPAAAYQQRGQPLLFSLSFYHSCIETGNETPTKYLRKNELNYNGPNKAAYKTLPAYVTSIRSEAFVLYAIR